MSDLFSRQQFLHETRLPQRIIELWRSNVEQQTLRQRHVDQVVEGHKRYVFAHALE